MKIDQNKKIRDGCSSTLESNRTINVMLKFLQEKQKRKEGSKHKS